MTEFNGLAFGVWRFKREGVAVSLVLKRRKFCLEVALEFRPSV